MEPIRVPPDGFGVHRVPPDGKRKLPQPSLGPSGPVIPYPPLPPMAQCRVTQSDPVPHGSPGTTAEV
jgi:hypothetical protein